MQALLIDFDSCFANTLGHVLEREGCRVQVASSATPALVLLDGEVALVIGLRAPADLTLNPGFGGGIDD